MTLSYAQSDNAWTKRFECRCKVTLSSAQPDNVWTNNDTKILVSIVYNLTKCLQVTITCILSFLYTVYTKRFDGY